MPNVKQSSIIAAPQADLFALAQDYDVRLEWDSFSRSLVFHDGATEAAAGVRASGRAWNGLTMEVEYIIVRPPDVAAMKMTRGPFFFASFSGSWRFEALGRTATRVVFNYHFTTPWKHLRPIADAIVRVLLTYEVKRRLRDLERAAEDTDILARLVARRGPTKHS